MKQVITVEEGDASVSTQPVETVHGTAWMTFGFAKGFQFFWPTNAEGVIRSINREPTLTELRAFLEYCKDPSNVSKYPPIPLDQ